MTPIYLATLAACMAVMVASPARGASLDKKRQSDFPTQVLHLKLGMSCEDAVKATKAAAVDGFRFSDGYNYDGKDYSSCTFINGLNEYAPPELATIISKYYSQRITPEFDANARLTSVGIASNWILDNDLQGQKVSSLLDEAVKKFGKPDYSTVVRYNKETPFLNSIGPFYAGSIRYYIWQREKKNKIPDIYSEKSFYPIYKSIATRRAALIITTHDGPRVDGLWVVESQFYLDDEPHQDKAKEFKL